MLELQLTLPEQLTLIRQLKLQLEEGCPAEMDRTIIEGFITRLRASPILSMAKAEAFCLLRYIRVQRARLLEDMRSVDAILPRLRVVEG